MSSRNQLARPTGLAGPLRAQVLLPCEVRASVGDEERGVRQVPAHGAAIGRPKVELLGRRRVALRVADVGERDEGVRADVARVRLRDGGGGREVPRLQVDLDEVGRGEPVAGVGRGAQDLVGLGQPAPVAQQDAEVVGRARLAVRDGPAQRVLGPVEVADRSQRNAQPRGVLQPPRLDLAGQQRLGRVPVAVVEVGAHEGVERARLARRGGVAQLVDAVGVVALGQQGAAPGQERPVVRVRDASDQPCPAPRGPG